MISSPSSTCRRRRALRATLIALVAVTGCQGSMRTWRRDDPTLRDLVVTPHPWDEPPVRDKPANSATASDRTRAAKAKAGRANPYSPTPSAPRDHYEPTDDVAAVGDEDPLFEVEDAEFKSLISQADPAHRAMLVQIYQAMQARRQAGSLIAQPDDRDSPTKANTDQYAADEHFVDEHFADSRQLAKSHSSPNPKSTNKNKRQSINDRHSDGTGPAAYTLSDRDDQVVPASAKRNIELRHIASDELGNPLAAQRDGFIHYQLSDNADEESGQPLQRNGSQSRATPQNSTAKSSVKPQEMKPPAKPRADRGMAYEPVADTGYEEPIPGISPARGPREDAYATSSRKHASAQALPLYTRDAVDDHYTDSSHVIQASAESSATSEPNVQPATLRPSARASSNHSTNAVKLDNAADSSSRTTEARDEDWRELAQKTLRSLEQEPVDSGENAQLHHHMTKRILWVLLGQLDQALDPIPGLKPQEQEYFRHNLQALSEAIDPNGHPVFSRRWPLVLESERNGMSHLGAVSNLEVKHAAFCSHVDGFGAITKFPTNKFKPGQEVLLYCEVDNFVSVKIKDGYETKLRGNYEIVDANQTRVADFILEEATDFCNSPRRDYFFVYHVYMPQTIAPGRYQLRLTIEDMKGNKFGQTSLDMQIAGQ